jgi:hypothetical protein
MRVLALLLLGGLALAASLDEARALYARGEMEGALARLKPLLSGYDPLLHPPPRPARPRPPSGPRRAGSG